VPPLERQVQQEKGAEEVPPELQPLRLTWQVQGQEQQMFQVEVEGKVHEKQGKSKMPTELWGVFQRRLLMMGR